MQFRSLAISHARRCMAMDAIIPRSICGIRYELKFRFVLMDSWFSATENFEFITAKGRHFIAAMKDNRLISVTEDDRNNKRFLRVEDLDLPEQTVVRGWLKGYAKE